MEVLVMLWLIIAFVFLGGPVQSVVSHVLLGSMVKTASLPADVSTMVGVTMWLDSVVVQMVLRDSSVKRVSI